MLRSLLLGVSLTLCACQAPASSFEDLPATLRTVDVRATLEPGATLPETATFCWMPGTTVRVGPGYDAFRVDRAIRTAIEADLRTRGYYAAPGNRGDLWLGYAIATEDAVDGDALDREYGITGRRTASGPHERGALVVDLVDRQSGRPLWRGSATILTDPSLDEELRTRRIEHGVHALFDRLKPGY